MAGDPLRPRPRRATRPAPGPRLPRRRGRSALARLRRVRALVAAEPGASRPHPDPSPRRQGVHAARRERAPPAGRGGRRTDPHGVLAARHVRRHRRLRPALLGGGHLLVAGRAGRRPSAAAGLVARDRQDVRAGHDRRAAPRRRPRRRRVHRLRRGPDRREAAVTGPGAGVAARRCRGGRRPAQRRRDRVHRDRAAQRRARGHGQHPRQRDAGVRAAPRRVAAGQVRRGRGAHGDRGDAALGRAPAIVRALGAGRRRRDRRSATGGRRRDRDAVRRRQPRSPPLRRRRSASTPAAATPPTSGSAAASTSASARRWPAWSWRPASPSSPAACPGSRSSSRRATTRPSSSTASSAWRSRRGSRRRGRRGRASPPRNARRPARRSASSDCPDRWRRGS